MECLLSLPDELLLEVVSHLDPASVISLHGTCKRLRKLTRLDSTLWRSLCAHQAYEDNPPDTPQWNHSEELAAVVVDWPIYGVDWYDEFKYRHGKLHTRWISPLQDEVKGLTSVATGNTHQNLLLAPLEDGAVSVWSSTAEVHRSKPGILSVPTPRGSRHSAKVEPGDNIVASPELDRIYVAADSTLVELSLTTLQVVSKTRFPFAISTLSSELVQPHPLTVGTTLTLHLHDHRVATVSESSGTNSAPFLSHTPLFQPSPLSILHHPNDNIYVAGRFPSILCYDRKMWPRLETIHSGGRLCTLAADGMDGLIAGGTYNGKGTVESYSLPDGTARNKNRQNASWGKVLSVSKQGTRVISCDSEGTITWFERDCRYVVRREEVWDQDLKPENMLWAEACEGGPVRKAVVMKNDEGLAVWSNDRIAIVSTHAGDTEEEEEEDGVLVETSKEILEKEMDERMRRALYAQADEVRILGSLLGR